MDINNVQLRQFLNDTFSGDELHDLCFDYFPRVQQEFTSGMVKSDQIRLLLSHCRNHGERSRLIGALQELRPGPFQQAFELTQPEPAPSRATATLASRNPRQIFISHANEDARLAHRLAGDLQQHGWQTWIAPDNIQPGEKWVAAIDRGLAESGVFLLLISKHAVQSRWVKSETNIAIQWEHERKMRFVPLQTSSHPVANTPSFWQAYQFIPFAGRYQDGLAHLLAELDQTPYTPPAPKPSTGQAVLEMLHRIPSFAWAVVALALLATLLWAWPWGSGNDTEPTTVGQPTEAATQVVAIADLSTQQPSKTPQAVTVPPTSDPSATPQPPSTNTPPPPTATSDPNIPPAAASLHDTWQRPQDGMAMVYVPAGTFMMGSDPDNDPNAQSDEQPQHEVTLNAFWLDQTEVTNGQFGQFVAATDYETTAELEGTGFVFTGSGWEDTAGADWQHPRGPDSDLSGLDNHPVVLVSGDDADAYCAWAGGALPTEAQWEYAARGTDGRLFPWGDDSPSEILLNYNQNIGETTAVGTYSPQGDSWVDAQDMAGNVWEWVADWYDADYYESFGETAVNPEGPIEGDFKVLRGGSWSFNQNDVRAANRLNGTPDNRDDDIGFRCVVSPGK